MNNLFFIAPKAVILFKVTQLTLKALYLGFRTIHHTNYAPHDPVFCIELRIVECKFILHFSKMWRSSLERPGSWIQLYRLV
jgi:hypothetical protein